MKSYGIHIKGKGSPLFSDNQYVNMFTEHYLQFDDGGYEFKILTELRNFRNKGINDITMIDKLSGLLKSLNFPNKTPNKLSKSEVKFLTGGWFEEWAYYLISQHLSLGQGEIILGLNTFIDAENDLDVAFMHKNALYIIECKTSIGDKQLEESTIYKSGGLMKKFGRNAKYFLFTLSDMRDESTGDFKDRPKLRVCLKT